jgi:hypothetical protein
LVNFDLVSVFEKLIQSYPNVLLLFQNRFVDGRYAGERLLMIKVFYYGIREQKSQGLAEQFGRKEKRKKRSSPTSF